MPVKNKKNIFGVSNIHLILLLICVIIGCILMRKHSIYVNRLEGFRQDTITYYDLSGGDSGQGSRWYTNIPYYDLSYVDSSAACINLCQDMDNCTGLRYYDVGTYNGANCVVYTNPCFHTRTCPKAMSDNPVNMQHWEHHKHNPNVRGWRERQHDV